MKKFDGLSFQSNAFFKKVSHSITKPYQHHLASLMQNQKKFFIPTLSSLDEILFWFGLVMVYTCYGVGIQSQYFNNQQIFLEAFVNIFIVNFCIIFSIIFFIHVSIEKYQNESVKHVSKQVLLATLIITPLAFIFSKLLIFFIFAKEIIFYEFLKSIIIHTLLVLLFTVLLLYYFAVQYRKISIFQQKYQQKLIEQNERLKARITSHFFFNMLNALQQLVESDTEKATQLIGHIAKLYRASFDEVREIAFTDELKLCEHYLAIEQYRFGEKLIITWSLPDEDLLYDMVITGLTLQMVIEKMILFVVEMSTQTIHLAINVNWENDRVTIILSCNLPENSQDIQQEIEQNLSFIAQIDMLQHHFGETAYIYYVLEHEQNSTKPNQIMTCIEYPLKDMAI